MTGSGSADPEGSREETTARVVRVLEEWGDQVAFYIAQVVAARGETDRAFELLDRARENGEPELVTAVTEPMPRARVRVATRLKPGARTRLRAAR